MQKISRKRGSLFFRRRQNQTPLPSPFYSTPSTQNRPPWQRFLQYSTASLTELATQWHGGITCACHCVAKIASSQLPAEKNRPRTPQSTCVEDGTSAPVQKIPPRSTSELPLPPSDDTSLPTDPPNALSTWRKPEGARADTKTSSNRPDVKILFDRLTRPT